MLNHVTTKSSFAPSHLWIHVLVTDNCTCISAGASCLQNLVFMMIHTTAIPGVHCSVRLHQQELTCQDWPSPSFFCSSLSFSSSWQPRWWCDDERVNITLKHASIAEVSESRTWVWTQRWKFIPAGLHQANEKSFYSATIHVVPTSIVTESFWMATWPSRITAELT